MNIKSNVFVVCLFFSTLSALSSQEFATSVKVSAPTLQLTDPKMLTSMQNNIEEFMNTHQWTNEEYRPEEKINLNLQFTITQDISSNTFRVDLGIQATRPVYNSSYESSLLTHLDKGLAIVFEEFKPIQGTQNAFTDNLSSLLSYYAYLILALDKDSFSSNGGTEYLNICKEIVNSIPPKFAREVDRTWVDPSQRNTKYNIVDDLLNPKMKAYRQGWYEYHRKGLDLLYSNVSEAKLNMKNFIKTVDELNTTYANMYLIRIFSNTKAPEITNVFQIGDQKDRFEMYTMMTRIDPANSAKYEPIRRG